MNNNNLSSLYSIFNDDLSSFQNGVDTIYNKCKSLGSTPNTKTPNDIINSIQSIYDNAKSSGFSDYILLVDKNASNTINYYVNHGATLYATNEFTNSDIYSTILVYTYAPSMVTTNKGGVTISSTGGTMINLGNYTRVYKNANNIKVTTSTYATADTPSTNGGFSNRMVIIGMK